MTSTNALHARTHAESPALIAAVAAASGGAVSAMAMSVITPIMPNTKKKAIMPTFFTED
jgi:hypothetical protein